MRKRKAYKQLVQKKTALYQVIFLRLCVHMNQHETFAHHVKSSGKSQSATPKRSENVPLAFLHLLSGTLCHPASEILLPFRCLNPDSKLTCLRQLSASRISAVFSPRLPPLHLPPSPPSQTPTLTPRMNVLPECFNCHGC